MELCDASLNQVFLPSDDPKKYRGPNLPYYLVVLIQLATGLEYIHSQNLIHGDIKPENVLISVNSFNKMVTMKWTDFGFLRLLVSDNGTYQTNKLEGIKNWLAPELLNIIDKLEREDTHEKEILLEATVKSDTFAMGLVFAYFLKDGKHPYGSTKSEIQQNLRSQAEVRNIISIWQSLF